MFIPSTLIKKCKIKIKTNGELFFERKNLLTFLNWCDQNGIGNLGIEGFEYDEVNESMMPRMDLIADFSSLVNRDGFDTKRSNDAARYFLKNECPDGLLYNIVLR